MRASRARPLTAVLVALALGAPGVVAAASRGDLAADGPLVLATDSGLLEISSPAERPVVRTRVRSASPAMTPMVSPDGRLLAYRAQGRLRLKSLIGGRVARPKALG